MEARRTAASAARSDDMPERGATRPTLLRPGEVARRAADGGALRSRRCSAAPPGLRARCDAAGGEDLAILPSVAGMYWDAGREELVVDDEGGDDGEESSSLSSLDEPAL